MNRQWRQPGFPLNPRYIQDKYETISDPPMSRGAQPHDQVQRLKLLTHGAVEDDTIEHALDNGKSQQLVEVVRKIVEHFQLPLQEDTLEVSGMSKFLDDRFTSYNVYSLPTVAWRRGNYLCTLSEVEYGNCPDCLRAYPVGFYCDAQACATIRMAQQRPAARAGWLYVVDDSQIAHHQIQEEEWIDPDYNGVPRYLLETYINPVKAVDLAKKIMGYTVGVNLDRRVYNRKISNYDPDNETLWSFIDLQELFQIVLVQAPDRMTDTSLLLDISTVAGFDYDLVVREAQRARNRQGLPAFEDEDIEMFQSIGQARNEA